MPKDDILSLVQMIFCCCQSLIISVKSSMAKFPETLRLEWSWSPSQLNTWRGEETKINFMIMIFVNLIAIRIKCIKLIIMIIDIIKIIIINIKLIRFAMHIVNGAGSAPHQEQPEIVNKHIAKFIKGSFVIQMMRTW